MILKLLRLQLERNTTAVCIWFVEWTIVQNKVTNLNILKVFLLNILSIRPVATSSKNSRQTDMNEWSWSSVLFYFSTLWHFIVLLVPPWMSNRLKNPPQEGRRRLATCPLRWPAAHFADAREKGRRRRRRRRRTPARKWGMQSLSDVATNSFSFATHCDCFGHTIM